MCPGTDPNCVNGILHSNLTKKQNQLSSLRVREGHRGTCVRAWMEMWDECALTRDVDVA